MPAWIQLGLPGGEGAGDQAPAHHAQAAINELLQIDSKERGMQLDAPPVVPDEVAGETAILRSGPPAAFEIEQQAEDQGEEHQRCQHLAESFPEDAGLEEPQSKGAAEEKRVGDEPGGNSIELVTRAVSAGRDRALEGLPGQSQEQDQLDQDEDEHDPGGSQARPGPMRRHGPPAGRLEQRQERAVEWLEGADDPEKYRCGWSDENEAQRPQRGANEVGDGIPAAGSPGGELPVGKGFRDPVGLAQFVQGIGRFAHGYAPESGYYKQY